jgi:transposase
LVAYERVEIVSSAERRRRWSVSEKLRLVAESHKAEGGIAEVAARADLHPSLLQRWRREARDGTLVVEPGLGRFVPVAIGDVGSVVAPGLTAAVTGGSVVAGRVEIELPNGCRIRVEQDIPALALRRIIGVLARQ